MREGWTDCRTGDRSAGKAAMAESVCQACTAGAGGSRALCSICARWSRPSSAIGDTFRTASAWPSWAEDVRLPGLPLKVRPPTSRTWQIAPLRQRQIAPHAASCHKAFAASAATSLHCSMNANPAPCHAAGQNGAINSNGTKPTLGSLGPTENEEGLTLGPRDRIGGHKWRRDGIRHGRPLLSPPLAHFGPGPSLVLHICVVVYARVAPRRPC